ncbi:MAG: methylmalonyl Co-A mutase-associated GTPase MeaB [Candidatus Neomarinimicrobiota bacterium]|nr:methylmalonyl Co-A mutase-associated GTPase MeaB [Candidatus Neomarinimicrobiota bacterium]|tara:strand:+ start:13 stop:945 length:933 start_codon:yes stop_codon:yes gene_type:complete
MDKVVIQNLEANNQRDLSRLITKVENDGKINNITLDKLFKKTNQAIRIGITGPPGAGKSSITNELIKYFIDNDQKVGIIAIDPTSPFSGGSLLGDRVRMNQYHNDENVFIRSMSTHGHLGGLSRKAQDIGDILAITGKDVIIFETVGVGQGEYEIANVADLTIIVLVPESGDEVQLMKAGLIEIGDLFVVNKSDRKGSEQLTEKLKSIININKEVTRPVYNTIAKEGKGIEELFNGIMKKFKELEDSGYLLQRRIDRYKVRVKNIIQENLLSEFWTSNKKEKLNQATNSLQNLKKSPMAAAEKIMESIDL